MKCANTLISYCYRDAGNWKLWGELVVEGHVTRKDLVPYLFDGEWFIPERVGLKHLMTEPWSADDHVFHELHEFKETSQPNAICRAEKFIERFKAAHSEGWFGEF